MTPQTRPGPTSWSRSLISFVSLAGLMIAAGLLITGIAPLAPPLPPIEQPLAFSHRRHLAPDVLDGDCSVCHERVYNTAAAGAPPTDLCLGCHLGLEPQTADEHTLRAYGDSGREIPWRRIWRLPAHAYSSHRVHVGVAGIACAECHGAIAEAQSLSAPLKVLTMADCIACHAAWPDHPAAAAATPAAGVRPIAAVSTDCNACHR